MLDIIIPVYNNYNGLAATLASFGVVNRIKYHFIIIDDASINIDYSPIINFYSQWFDIQYYKLEKNMGPGVARNVGLTYISHEFVTFIDAGDEIYHTFSFFHVLSNFIDNENLMFLSTSHVDVRPNGDFEEVWEGNNRIHGKIYRAKFLKKYNITFGEDQSKCNEDIGFNICCRLICNELQARDPDNQYFMNLNQDIILWMPDDAESLTYKDNCAFYYKDQNLGLAVNSIHAIEIAIKAGVRAELILDEIYSIFVSQWKFYVCTANSRPEFMGYALTGAYYFYKNCFTKYPFSAQKLLQYQNIELAHINWFNDPFSEKLFIFNILDFIKLLEEQEK